MISRLSAEKKAAYLANVLSVAKIQNGTVTPEEASALQSIAAKLKAGRNDILEARKLIENGGYQLKVMTDPPLRMANLEDMLLMALADGVVHDDESAPIEKMAKAMRFSQTDIDMAIRRARARLARLSQENQVKNKINKTDIPFDAVAVSKKRIGRPTVEPHSQIVLSVPSWQTRADPVETPGELEALPEDNPDISGIDIANLETQDAEPFSCLEQCAMAREISQNPEAYCFGAGDDAINTWGCRLIGMPWEPGADWLNTGHFRDDRVFVFNRGDISGILNERLTGAAECPYLRNNYVKKALAAFPSKAFIGTRWTYRPADTQDSKTMTVREYIHGCSVSTKREAGGIDPVGRAEALRIIRDACRRANRPRPAL